MKKYRVGAVVTISIYTDVEAKSRKQALEIAKGRPMMTIPAACGENPADEWVAEELDGEAKDLGIEDDE